MPLKPHPTDPDKMVYYNRQYDLPQRTWVGLSDGVMCDIAMDHNFMSTDWIDFARAIEAKLKENNSAA